MSEFEWKDDNPSAAWSFEDVDDTASKRRTRRESSAPDERAQGSHTRRNKLIASFASFLVIALVVVVVAALRWSAHDPFLAVQERQKQLLVSERAVEEVFVSFRKAVPDFSPATYTYVAYTDQNLVEDLDERLRDAQWLMDHRLEFEQAMARYIADHRAAHKQLLEVARDAQEFADSPQHPGFKDKYQAHVQQASDWAAYYANEAASLEEQMISFEEDFRFVQASVLFMTRAKAFASIRPTMSEDGEKVRQYLKNLQEHMERFRETMQRFRGYVPAEEVAIDSVTA